MAAIRVVTRDGKEHLLNGESGVSVMEIIRENGIDELLALCGGCCICATCHVYVDPKHLSSLSDKSDDEISLLEDRRYARPNSRLACQLRFSASLANMQVEIAPAE